MSGIAEGLMRLRTAGFHPEAVLDVGAYEGWFARTARAVWPAAHILMVEAIQEKEPHLAATCTAIGNADYALTLVGSHAISATPFHFVKGGTADAPINTGSSKYREKAGYPTEQRFLPQITIDDLVATRAKAFQLLKLDVQGAELDVLAGSGMALRNVQVILMEISLVQYNDDAPLLADVIARMVQLGFVLADIVDQSRFGDSLLQIDGVFVRPDSPYRLTFRS